jgi:hypothetical protein
MTILVFEASGRCIMAIDGEMSDEQLAVYRAAVRIGGYVNPDTVWYDFDRGGMGYRREFNPVVSVNTISNLPPGTKAFVKGEYVEVDDGSLELEVDYPETIPVVLMHVRLLDKTVMVPCEATS